MMNNFSMSLIFLHFLQIGSVDSMDLPMACTLTQIQSNSVYYFAIRPVDEYERLGIWSNTATIELAAVDS